MRRVGSMSLWVGGRGDLRDVSSLVRGGVKALVDLALDEPPVPLSREMMSCRFPLLDGAGNDPSQVRAAVLTVAALIRARVPTLVACSAGMSRSPAISAGAVALATGNSADDCLRTLIHGGPGDVSGGLWADVFAAVIWAGWKPPKGG